MMYRIGGLFILLILTIISHVAAQNLSVAKRKYFRLDPNVTSQDYQPGYLYVKLKPEFHGSEQMANGRTSDNEIFNYLNVNEIKPVIHKNQLSSIRARSSKPFRYDISSYQKVKYNNRDIFIEDAINLLYQTGMFEIIEPVYINRMDYVPNDSLLSRQYYLELTKTFEAWDLTRGDAEIVVGVVDSGIDINHPDIVNNLWFNEADPIDGIDNDNNGYIDDYNGWDFAGSSRTNDNDQDNDPRVNKGGSFSHGTGVGGVIGATPDNEIGFAGVGFNTKLLFTKHSADDQGTDELSLFNTYEGVLYCASMGVDIINCSWGSNFRSQFAQDIINFVVEDLDVIVVAAAGNSGSEEDDHFPSAYNNVISVSAVNSQLKISNFTSYGKTVDISAPGSNIAVLEYNNDYGSTQGTSFSTPIVAGGLALVKAFRPGLSAQQYAELVRVTSNDTIYDVNFAQILKNKLGKGILDIEKALTENPAAVRMLNYRLFNSEGKIPAPGEEGLLVAEFKNFLWPSTGGMKVKLSSKSSLIEVLNEESVLGKIEMDQVISNTANPFRIRLKETIPNNLRIELLLEFTDAGYYDYQFITILLNPTFLNVEENQISSSVAQNGRLGYQDTEQSEGLGFVVNENNILFEMGLITGSSSNELANNVRSRNQEYDNDFLPLKSIVGRSPGDFSASEITGSFNNTQGDSAINQVDVSYRSMVWKEEPNERFYIIEYTISNPNDFPLENYHYGIFADWDVSTDGQMDRALWNDSLSLGYVYNTDTSEKDLHIGGIQVLSGEANYFAIDNDQSNEGNPFGIYDGFTDEEKFRSISSGIGRDSAGFSLTTGADVSHTVASGPYTIEPGGQVKVAFAIHGAISFDQLIRSAQAADTMYNFTLQAPVPQITSPTICYNDSATLIATGAEKFKWYRTKTGGEAFFSGSDYTTGILKNDTVFYVSNADSTYESVRTPARVVLRAVPEITLSGSPSLCPDDTVVLIAAKADSYRWSPGDFTSQSLIVTEAGTYSVTVSDDELGCESTSKEIIVEKFDAPEASFMTDPSELKKNTATEVSVTDQSVDAVSWFWSLSTGETSMMENPVFTIETNDAVSIKLTVTSENGCQDTTAMILDVITGFENNLMNESWKLYPVPTEGNLFYELNNNYTGPVILSVYDIRGKILLSEEFIKTNKQNLGEIKTGSLPAGIYIVKIFIPSVGTASKRVLIR